MKWYSGSARSGRSFRSHGSGPAWSKSHGQGSPAGWTRRSGRPRSTRSCLAVSGMPANVKSEAVETVLHAFPQLHVGMIWDRLRRLQKQRTADLQAVVTAFVVASDCNDRVEARGGQADSSATA